jgi:hypothetical protein
MSKEIVIFGTGIAGLLAGKAAIEEGWFPTFYDRDYRKKAITSGLHYLHDNCGIPAREYVVNNYVVSKGSESIGIQYCKKIFGCINNTALNNSLTDLPEQNTFYDMREIYSDLYDSLQEYFAPEPLNVDCDNAWNFDVPIISTIPLPLLFPNINCRSEKVFYKEGIAASRTDKNYVVYNTISSDDWYRTSSIMGYQCTEYINDVPDSKPMYKIITANVDRDRILDDYNILLIGRYGAWDRKFLAHNAYYTTQRVLRQGGLNERI